MLPEADVRTRLARAFLAFGLAAPLAYVGQRLAERTAGVPVDPLLVLREAHTAYYWRCATALWWGGVVFAAVFAWRARTRDGSLPRWVSFGALALGAALVLATWRWP